MQRKYKSKNLGKGCLKKGKSLKVLGMIAAFFIAFLLMFHTEKAMAVELYFDEEGNLMHVTKDSKTSAYTCFRSVGWIIKRYDMPLNAKGQQYVVVAKRSDRNVTLTVDGTDIMYTYFKSSKEEILSAVEKVSVEWLKQLNTYGGMVYIDTAMTVVENRVPQGGIDASGNRWGEVYLTFDGIANARAWGGLDALRLYFGMCVEFPCLAKIPGPEISLSEKEYEYTSTPISSMLLEAKENYDISVAIPSGSILRARGKVSNYKYYVKVGKVDGTVKLPVKVQKTYILNWIDSNGDAKSETRKIDRYYLVERSFSYYTCKDVKLWGLSKIGINNECITGGVYKKNVNSSIKMDITKYGDENEHINVYFNGETINAGTETLSRADGLKPDIPYEDLSTLANNAVINISAKSDKIILDGNYVLRDDVCQNNGKAPVYFEPPCSVIDFNDIKISELARNQKYEGTYKVDYTLKANYTGSGVVNDITNKGALNPIKIHTPVICEGEIEAKEGQKDLQGNEVKKGNIVVVGEFLLNIKFSGKHSDYRGYGDRDYSEYIRDIYVKLPFDVYYQNELKQADTWIKVTGIDKDGVVKGFKLTDDVVHGEYEAEIKAYAINSMASDVLGGEYTNAPTDGYYATNKIKLNVIRGFFDTTEYTKYKVVGTH